MFWEADSAEFERHVAPLLDCSGITLRIFRLSATNDAKDPRNYASDIPPFHLPTPCPYGCPSLDNCRNQCYLDARSVSLQEVANGTFSLVANQRRTAAMIVTSDNDRTVLRRSPRTKSARTCGESSDPFFRKIRSVDSSMNSSNLVHTTPAFSINGVEPGKLGDASGEHSSSIAGLAPFELTLHPGVRIYRCPHWRNAVPGPPGLTYSFILSTTTPAIGSMMADKRNVMHNLLTGQLTCPCCLQDLLNSTGATDTGPVYVASFSKWDPQFMQRLEFVFSQYACFSVDCGSILPPSTASTLCGYLSSYFRSKACSDGSFESKANHLVQSTAVLSDNSNAPNNSKPPRKDASLPEVNTAEPSQSLPCVLEARDFLSDTCGHQLSCRPAQTARSSAEGTNLSTGPARVPPCLDFLRSQTDVTSRFNDAMQRLSIFIRGALHNSTDAIIQIANKLRNPTVAPVAQPLGKRCSNQDVQYPCPSFPPVSLAQVWRAAERKQLALEICRTLQLLTGLAVSPIRLLGRGAFALARNGMQAVSGAVSASSSTNAADTPRESIPREGTSQETTTNNVSIPKLRYAKFNKNYANNSDAMADFLAAASPQAQRTLLALVSWSCKVLLRSRTTWTEEVLPAEFRREAISAISLFLIHCFKASDAVIEEFANTFGELVIAIAAARHGTEYARIVATVDAASISTLLRGLYHGHRISKLSWSYYALACATEALDLSTNGTYSSGPILFQGFMLIAEPRRLWNFRRMWVVLRPWSLAIYKAVADFAKGTPAMILHVDSMSRRIVIDDRHLEIESVTLDLLPFLMRSCILEEFMQQDHSTRSKNFTQRLSEGFAKCASTPAFCKDPSQVGKDKEADKEIFVTENIATTMTSSKTARSGIYSFSLNGGLSMESTDTPYSSGKIAKLQNRISQMTMRTPPTMSTRRHVTFAANTQATSSSLSEVRLPELMKQFKVRLPTMNFHQTISGNTRKSVFETHRELAHQTGPLPVPHYNAGTSRLLGHRTIPRFPAMLTFMDPAIDADFIDDTGKIPTCSRNVMTETSGDGGPVHSHERTGEASAPAADSSDDETVDFTSPRISEPGSQCTAFTQLPQVTNRCSMSPTKVRARVQRRLERASLFTRPLPPLPIEEKSSWGTSRFLWAATPGERNSTWTTADEFQAAAEIDFWAAKLENAFAQNTLLAVSGGRRPKKAEEGRRRPHLALYNTEPTLQMRIELPDLGAMELSTLDFLEFDCNSNDSPLLSLSVLRARRLPFRPYEMYQHLIPDPYVVAVPKLANGVKLAKEAFLFSLTNFRETPSVINTRAIVAIVVQSSSFVQLCPAIGNTTDPVWECLENRNALEQLAYQKRCAARNENYFSQANDFPLFDEPSDSFYIPNPSAVMGSTQSLEWVHTVLIQVKDKRPFSMTDDSVIGTASLCLRSLIERHLPRRINSDNSGRQSNCREVVWICGWIPLDIPADSPEFESVQADIDAGKLKPKTAEILIEAALWRESRL